MKHLVTMPARTHLHPELELALKASGIPYSPLYGHTDLARARSWVLTKALQLGAEVIISIDSDVIPTPDTILALAGSVSHNEAVTGLYPKRDGSGWAARLPDRKGGSVPSTGRFRIEDAGLGLCALHRTSLLRVAAQLPIIVEDETNWWPFCVPEFSAGGRYWADDDSLWKRLREAGVDCWCDPLIRAAHAVETRLTEPNFAHTGREHGNA